MSNNVIWAGPRLLVPITVEALVVTSVSNATQFSVQPLQLNEYNKHGLINPDPFVDTGMPKTPGVYLNWALPDGMTQGVKPKNGGPVQYPYLPNRWLIIRYSPNNTAPTASWIVESDYLFSQPPTDNRPVQSPYINANENQEAQVSIIGNVYDFAGWTEQGQNTPLFLNAVGNSDLMFTAYAGNNSFVFSFLDAFTETTAAEVSYLVCGWCANVEYDILYNVAQQGVQGWTTEQDWIDLMTLLQWSVGSEAIDKNTDLDNAMTAAANWLKAQGITPPDGLPGTLTAQTLCHGLVFDVNWPGVNAEAPASSVPVFNPADPQTVPYIAAANTSADCMAAFMQWQLNYNNADPDGEDGDVEIMLEAFSHKMLPQPGGVIDTPDLMNAIHSSWFGHLPGGTTWVVQTQSNQTTVPPVNPNEAPNTQAPASLTPQLAAQLAALNAQQAKFDNDCRVLSSWQSLMYADWMKLNICNNAIGGCTISQKLNAAITADTTAINTLITQLTADVALLNADIAALTAALSTSNLVLQNNPANKFFLPNDPAFMVNNIHRSYKRGEDIIYSKDDNYLFVRFTGQFINSLQVNTGTTKVAVNGSDIAPQFTSNNQIPTEIPALLAEAALLDIGFAIAIAQKATGQTNPPQNIINTVQQQQTLIWNSALDSSLDQQTLEQIPGFNPGDTLFHIPSKIGVWQWEQPWNPLYLEWEVNFFQATGMSNWQFDGFDYSWTGSSNLPLTNGYTLKGRSLLTPKEAVTLQSQLTEFINSYQQGKLPSDYIPLNDVLNGVGDWDVLSQTIKGFMMQFLQWDIQQFGYLPTDPTIANPMGYNPLNPAQPQISGYGMPLALPSDAFYPLLAGFVQILNLWVVDDFGQVYNINPATGNNPPNPKQPIPGIGFEPPGYTLGEQLPVCFQLPPRVVQASRLNFNLISAKNDSVLSDQDTTTTPISGWLLPNHIDDSVSVYDNNGLILGEIELVGATGNQHAQWQPAPITGVDAINISNEHLKGFVQGILGSTAGNQGTTPWSGIALANFLTVIDETLWSVDPLGERSNQSLSVLIGRPIAVVRASLELELYGNPATNLSFAKTSGQDNGGIGNYTFDTQIGNIGLANDGVMGYFSNNNYSQFNSVHYSLVETPDKPPYVVNNYLPLQFLANAPSYVTILLDPRGSIHCSTGILPVLETILPDLYVGNVMNNMLLEFDCGPLILDNQTWKVPLPAGAGLNWSWMQPSQANNQLAYTEITSLVAANASVDWPINPPTILEGKLKLAGALGSQPSIYFFGVNNFGPTGNTPPVYTIPAGTVPQLSWAGQGASATLTIGKASPVSVPLNSSGYALSGTGTQNVTLTIADSKGANQQTMSITVIINT